MPVQKKSTRRAAGKSGWVYVAVDKNAPDLVKIGQTQVPDARHKQLGKPQYLARIPCTDCKEFEEKLHREFDKYRCAQSEYFNLSDESLDLLLRMCASEYEDFKSLTVEPSLANKLEQVETEIKLISKFGSTGMQLREVRTRSDHKHNCLAEGCDGFG